MNSASEIRNVIARLEQVAAALEGKPTAASTQVQEVQGLQAFKEAVHQFQDAAEPLEAALKDITPHVLKAFKQMEIVVQQSTQSKKITADQCKQIQKVLNESVSKIAKHQTHQLQYQFKAILEGINTIFWVTVDAPIMQIDSAIDASEYNGLKVKQQKVVEVTKWYDAFIHALKLLKEFVTNHFKMGLDWNPKGTKSFDDLLAAVKEEKSAGGPPPPPAPKLPPPPVHVLPTVTQQEGGTDRAQLFNQINVGEDITKRLRHVDKNAVREEKQNAAPLAPKVKQVVAQTAPVKPPKRFFSENWYLENFKDEKLIEFKEDEIDMKQSLFVDNCINCGIIIKPKVKSIFLQNCQKVQLVFEQTVSGLDIVGGKKIEVTCLNQCPSFMVDNSESVRMTFHQSRQCEIISAKTMDLNITYLQEDGELAKDAYIPEQFLTSWDETTKKFITKPLDTQFG